MSKVLIDVSAACDQQAGVGRYSRNIIERLILTGHDVDWTAFHAPAARVGSVAEWSLPQNVRSVRYPFSRRRFDQIGVRLGMPLPLRPFTGQQDLVYSPDFVAPPMRGVPRIVTIHDLAFLTHPHLTTPGTASLLRTVVERERRRGTYFATVSRTTRDRVEHMLGVSSERVRVISNGVDKRFFDADPLDDETRDRLAVPPEYLLMVGTIEPRKNHATVLAALRSHNGGLPLVIVGRVGWGVDHLLREIEELERAGGVVWLRDLDDGLLPSLYAGAKGVLYPSWTEGFGLPVLEGLAAGKPVITGNDPVFAEVGGGLVTMVPPGDEAAIADAIREIESASSPGNVEDRRRAWAARYNWDAPATELRRWIDELKGAPGG